VSSVFVMESVRCSSTAILERSERLACTVGADGYNIALQVYGSKRPGAAVLSWIGGSSPFARRLRMERAKPKRERRYPGPEEANRLEQLPCELIDTFDPAVIRDSIVWLREWLLTHDDPHVEGLWLDHRRGTAFDKRECAERVFMDLAPIFDFACRSIERGERVLRP
jgi:hypothetical protein